MGGSNKPALLDAKNQQIKSILSTQKLIKATEFCSWCIKIYWGQLPTFSDVMQLGFSGYAITDDINKALPPDLESTDGTQVVIGERSVIIWSASSEDELVGKINKAFKKLQWSK